MCRSRRGTFASVSMARSKECALALLAPFTLAQDHQWNERGAHVVLAAFVSLVELALKRSCRWVR